MAEIIELSERPTTLVTGKLIIINDHVDGSAMINVKDGDKIYSLLIDSNELTILREAILTRSR